MTKIPLPGKLFRIIRGTQQPRLARQIIVDLALIPDVIAGGETFDAESENLLGERGVMPNPPAAFSPLAMVRWIFSCGNDFAGDAARRVSPGRSEDVANKK